MAHIQIAPVKGIILEWLFFSLAAVLVVLRVYLRYFRQQLFSLTDAAVVLSLVFFAACVASDTALVAYGFWDPKMKFLPPGATIGTTKSIYTDLPASSIHKLPKMLFAFSYPYALCLWCVKVTLLLLYYTLIPPRMVILRYCLNAVSAVVVFTFIVVIAMNTFWCYPISSNWSPATKSRPLCISYDEREVYVTSTVLHIFTELLIFALPFPLLRTLRALSRESQKRVYAMFSLGLITIAISVGRLACILTMTGQSYQVVGICQLWSSVEMCCSITVVCLPALKGFVGEAVKRRKGLWDLRRLARPKSVNSDETSEAVGVILKSDEAKSEAGEGHSAGSIHGKEEAKVKMEEA